MKKGILLTATVLGSLFVSTYAVAGTSANVGVTSNYMWRGATQSDDKAALQAGLDYSADNGLYVGTWASNVDFDGGYDGAELDIYGGYKKELANGLGYDVGVIQYVYPSEDIAADFSEVYGKVSYKGVGAEVSYTIDKEGTSTDEGDVYAALGYTGELANGWGYGAKVGRYNFKADIPGLDYNHAQLSLTKSTEKAGDFTFAVDKTTKTGLASTINGDDDPRVSVSWKKSFDF